jgi:Cys-tRNA(Pro)/Cys-tRNA(Cys) deacylase
MQKTNAIREIERLKIAHNTVEYKYEEDNLSVEKIAADNNLKLSAIFKTLVCLGADGEVIVALVGGDAQLSNKKLAKIAGQKNIDLAPMQNLLSLTGYVRGGCSPLGMKKRFRVFIDEAARIEEWIFVNAGRRGLLFGCSPDDLATAAGAIWAEIV